MDHTVYTWGEDLPNVTSSDVLLWFGLFLTLFIRIHNIILEQYDEYDSTKTMLVINVSYLQIGYPQSNQQQTNFSFFLKELKWINVTISSPVTLQ